MLSGNRAPHLTLNASYSIAVSADNDIKVILFDVMCCLDGVSEGQFKQVLEQELPLLKSLVLNPCVSIYLTNGLHNRGMRRFKYRSQDNHHCRWKTSPCSVRLCLLSRNEKLLIEYHRFFPQSERDADRSGNCPAGTVVDREIAHPTEFDFYLQSHGGLLGTSRPAHYSVRFPLEMQSRLR